MAKLRPFLAISSEIQADFSALQTAGRSGWDSDPAPPNGFHNLQKLHCHGCQIYHPRHAPLRAIARWPLSLNSAS
jgi:hypothetical protein